jgi:hypothetical protein
MRRLLKITKLFILWIVSSLLLGVALHMHMASQTTLDFNVLLLWLIWCFITMSVTILIVHIIYCIVEEGILGIKNFDEYAISNTIIYVLSTISLLAGLDIIILTLVRIIPHMKTLLPWLQ